MEKLFEFLARLQANNSKEWMDRHRSEYHDIRDWYIAWLNELDNRLMKIDPDYFPTEGRLAIHRINNNLMFHPDKPVYKDHIGATMDRVKGKSDFYIHLGTSGSFIAGGYYHPSGEILSAIREAIDYDGEILESIIDDPEFRREFGEPLAEDALKTAPKGFSKEHAHIGLLRLKSFAVMHELKREEVTGPGFMDQTVHLYKVMIPFRNYLNKAVSFAFES